jgi:hypothetical protein
VFNHSNLSSGRDKYFRLSAQITDSRSSWHSDPHEVNAQLRHEAQGGLPQPPLVPPPATASSSQVVPPSFDIEAAFTQLMSSMGALQREVDLIGECVQQCQIDIRECLQYHHPKPDDEDSIFFFTYYCLY